MDLKATRFEVDDHVAMVRLHRPHRHNAWTGRMHAEYRWIMAELEADARVRVVIVTGTPPAFCVGADTQALAGHVERGGYDDGLPPDVAHPGYGTRPEFDHDFVWHFGLRFPVIAAVNGACAGVGLALALFCDLRFVAEGARLTTAAPRLGLPAEFGTSWLLPRLVGVTRAADLLLSGRIVTGAETATWGLWNDVCADGEAAVEAAIGYARAMVANAAPSAMQVTKNQLYQDLIRHDVGASVERSQHLLHEMMGGADYAEGVRALTEKRLPAF